LLYFIADVVSRGKKNKISALHAAVALQKPAEFLKHLFYFIAHETRAAIK